MRYLLLLTTLLVPGVLSAQDAKTADAFKVPYRLSDVKHVVVRVKINGKGPFNFVVDTGAPAVYFGNEIAKKLGLEVKEAGYWETFDKLEIEGGIKLNDIKVRVEEPFQLVGMNKINAPGMVYHGVLGYTVLSRYQIEYDFTEPHLTLTKLDWTPPAPVPHGSLSEGATKNMKAMIGLSSMATSFMPKKKDALLVYRGMVGIEVAQADKGVTITRVLANTPASLAGLQVRDVIKTIQVPTTDPHILEKLENAKLEERDRVAILKSTIRIVSDLKSLEQSMNSVGTEHEIIFEIERGGEKKTIKLVTARGF